MSVNIRLHDIADEIRDSYIPNKEDSIPCIGLEHVEQETLHLSHVGSSQDIESNKLKFRTGDILFGTLRPYFRKVILADFDGICSTEFSFQFPCLPPSKRKNVGDMLSAYDDLIDNNRRRITLLEQSVRLLYKEWFAHLRFPGHEHTTIKLNMKTRALIQGRDWLLPRLMGRGLPI